MSQQESMLVVSAHAADFVWRAYMRVFPQVTDRLS